MSAGDTPDSSLTTRETVLRLTPARAATSRIVGRLLSFTPVLPPVRRPREHVHPASMRYVGDRYEP
jgi:hypothetical protein